MPQMFQTLSRSMAPGETLKAECGCGRQASWPQAQAMRVFGPDATPYDIRRRLRCLGCDRLDWARVWI
jgi:hypothetical protein